MRQCHKETNAESDENAVGKASKNDITDEVKQENIGTERDMSFVRSSLNATDPLVWIRKHPKAKSL